MTNSNELFSTGEVADALGIERWRLLYMIERRDLPEATYRVGGRRLFTAGDVSSLRAVLNRRTGVENLVKTNLLY